MRRTTPRFRLVLFALTLIASIATLQASAAAAKPWLGVYTQEVTSDLRDGLDLHGDGVLVNRVVADGPADRAGLRKGDLIVRLNSRSVGSPDELARLVGEARSGQTIALEILRDGDRRTLSVTLDPRPSGDAEERLAPRWSERDDDGEDRDKDVRDKVRVRVMTPDGDDVRKKVRVHVMTPDGEKGEPHVYRFDGDLDDLPEKIKSHLGNLHIEGLRDLPELKALAAVGARARLGVRIESLSDDLADAMGLQGDDGVLVMGVTEDSPAARAGIKAGDVILSVNGHDVKSPAELRDAVRDVDGKASVVVFRKGSRRTVEADLGRPERSGRKGDSLGPGRMEGLERLGRLRLREEAGDDELRKELDDLRQQLRELRERLEERK